MKMKTGTLTSMTSGLSIISLSILIIVSFSVEASAKRGCSAFGHSCFGGHGKRSNPDDQKQNLEVDPVSLKDEVLESSNDIMKFALNNEEIQQLHDFVKCRNCAVELSRGIKTQPNYLPLLIRKWLTFYHRPYNTDSETNEK